MKGGLNRNQVYLLVLIFLLGLGLRIYLSCDQFLHPWDERYHALVAKHVALHPLSPTLYEETPLEYDLKAWSANHIWLHKQPLPLWLIASSFTLFGESEFSVRIPSIFLSSLSILLTFFIAARLFDVRTGLIAALLHAINGLLIELCAGRIATDHYDTLFLFFIELGILFAVLNASKRKVLYAVGAGLCCGLAILTKWLPALIILPTWYLLNSDKPFRSKFVELTLISFATCIVVLPWQYYIYSHFPMEYSWENQYNLRHFSEILDDQGGPWYYYLNKIRINYSEIIYLPILLFLYLLFHKKNRNAVMALLCWVLVPLSFFSLAATKMQAYISFVAPALFIMSGYFIAQALSLYGNSSKTARVVAVLAVVVSFALPIRYCVERLKFFDKYDRNPAWSLALHELKQRQFPANKKLVIYGVKHPIEMMFYLNCTAYSIDSISDKRMGELAQYYIFVKNPTRNL